MSNPSPEEVFAAIDAMLSQSEAKSQVYDMSNVGFTVEAKTNIHPEWADAGVVCDTFEEAQKIEQQIITDTQTIMGEDIEETGFKTRIVAPVFH